MVDVEPLVQDEDVQEVRTSCGGTSATRTARWPPSILADWPAAQPRFVKVMPRDYKRALAAMRRAREEGIPWERAVMEGAHG